MDETERTRDGDAVRNVYLHVCVCVCVCEVLLPYSVGHGEHRWKLMP